MKALRVFKMIFLIWAFTLLGVAAVLGCTEGSDPSGSFTSLTKVPTWAPTLLVLGLLGLFLSFAKNDTARRIGLALSLATMILALCNGVVSMYNYGGVSGALLIVSFALYCLHFLFAGIAFVYSVHLRLTSK